MVPSAIKAPSFFKASRTCLTNRRACIAKCACIFIPIHQRDFLPEFHIWHLAHLAVCAYHYIFPLALLPRDIIIEDWCGRRCIPIWSPDIVTSALCGCDNIKRRDISLSCSRGCLRAMQLVVSQRWTCKLLSPYTASIKIYLYIMAGIFGGWELYLIWWESSYLSASRSTKTSLDLTGAPYPPHKHPNLSPSIYFAMFYTFANKI